MASRSPGLLRITRGGFQQPGVEHDESFPDREVSLGLLRANTCRSRSRSAPCDRRWNLGKGSESGQDIGGRPTGAAWPGSTHGRPETFGVGPVPPSHRLIGAGHSLFSKKTRKHGGPPSRGRPTRIHGRSDKKPRLPRPGTKNALEYIHRSPMQPLRDEKSYAALGAMLAPALRGKHADTRRSTTRPKLSTARNLRSGVPRLRAYPKTRLRSFSNTPILDCRSGVRGISDEL